MPMPMRDLKGEVFGRLTVVQFAEKNKYKQARWLCRCSCGTEKVIEGYSLTRGHTKSCGCLAKEALIKRNTKHGMKGTTEYKIWAAIAIVVFLFVFSVVTAVLLVLDPADKPAPILTAKEQADLIENCADKPTGLIERSE